MRPRRRFAPEPPRPARNELVNENIRSAQVRLIDEDGAQLGIQPTKEALEIAWAKNLDLVVVAAQADRWRRVELVEQDDISPGGGAGRGDEDAVRDRTVHRLPILPGLTEHRNRGADFDGTITGSPRRMC